MIPTVSVVVPTFNAEAFIEETLTSIWNQTLPPKEVIVIDDGSTDRTVDRLVNDPLIQVFRQENRGPSVARNHGAKIATSTYLAFLDADDLWTPTHLEKRVAELERQPNARFSWGLTSEFSEPTRRSQPLRGPYLGSLVFRREFFAAQALNPELRFAEDIDWLIRVLENKTPHIKATTLSLLYRRHPGSLTAQSSQGTQALIQVLSAALKRRRGGDSRISNQALR